VCEQIASRGTLWRCQYEGCERGGQQDGARTHLLVVACLALFFVLDRLDVVHAAGACFRRRARRGRDVLMAAAIFVYDLEAHGGEQRRGAVVARRGAPAVWARGERREGGAGPGRADWPARGSSARRDRTPAATAAGRGQEGAAWAAARMRATGVWRRARRQQEAGRVRRRRAVAAKGRDSEGASKREIWGGAMFYNAAILRARQTVPRAVVRLLPLPFAKTEVHSRSRWPSAS
jgi:hypothetical protein